NNLVAWQWFFGDGGSSTLRNPVHTYLNTGTYTVTLIVFDAFGCSDTLTKTDFIDLTRPQAAFAQDLDVICPGSPLQFVDLTVADYPISAWLWSFGDGTTSNQQNPVHTYAQPGTYTVTLTVTNILGCTDSETGSVEVLPPPVAAFTATPNEGCMPLTVAFDENAVGISSAVIFWQWDFGDGNGSNVPNPVYTYEEPGTYTVTLTVLDGNGCGKDTSMTIQVLPLPLANFSAVNNIGCAPQQVQFTSLAGGAYPIAGWLWKFGDGNTSALQNPAHTYAADGLYTITLIVTDINGCTDSLVRPQYVRLRHPDANFTWTPSDGCPPLNVNFRDATLSDTSIVAWAWNFGDGGTSTQQNVSHLYASPGVYTVTLTVTDINGCTNTEVKTNIIRAYTPPVAVWQPGDTSGCTPFAMNFYNNSVAGSAPITAYAWNFGNGNNSALPNPTQTFVTPGNYPVRLIVTDANGCRDTAIHTIFSRPLPTPDFNASDRVGCAPQQVFFSDQSVNASPVAAWLWNFGDGNTSTQQFPTHMYQNDGVYTVSLTLTDIYGCEGTVTRPQYIRLRRPQPDFSASQTVVCPGTAVQFTDLTLADTTLTDWLWQFSDGSLATQQNPVKVFSVPGFYSVTLTVHNLLDCGAAITKTSYIEVRQRPDADFVPSVSNGCAPLAVQFTNTTNSTSAPVASWFWDFANGSTSIFTNPSQTFVQPGTYPVRLVATDGFGCRDTVRKNIVVYRPPTATFIASDSVGCAPETINFLDQSVQGNAPISSWFWSFGDGGAAGQQFPSHTYNADGEYDVRLIVADLNGCRDTLLRPEYIRLSHPVADFVTSVTRTCPEAIVTFADASIPDTTLVSWLWNFGDGSTSTLQNPTHTYANGGTYTITLTVTNLLGCSHTISRPNVIQVYTQPVTLFTPSSLEGCTPFEVDFTDNSSGVSAPIVGWLWDFGDGSTSTAQNPTHTYMAPGLYTITLTTTDNNGCTSSHSRQVRGLTLPVANFMSLDTLGCAPETVHFTDLTQGDYPIVAWSWDFGDGNSSNAQFPTHTYAQQGLYDIRLIATDANGCRDTLIRRQYIRLRNPDANFSWSPSLGCPGMEVQFTDLSIPDTTIVNWQWNFGDGTGSVVVNPRHVYELPGTYTVSLTVTNVLGCSETQTYAQIITVATPPVAGFLVNDTLGCTPFTPGLTDNSQGIGAPVTQWQWSFGNGDSSALQEPVYTYPTPGTFTMTLVITDNNGCKDTASQVVASTRSPVANFMSRDTVGCAPKLVRFRDLSSGDYPITYWNWSFGNGFTSPQQNASHTYLNDGVYTVRLIVGDDNGCLDTLIRRRYIRLSHPDADFTAADRNGCVGTAVSFQDRSIQDTTIVAWRWDFGDGTFSVQQNPVHVYDQPGEYDVRLVVTNINGCSDTLLQTNYVDIFTPPTASFVATDTSGCVPFLVDFTDFSSSPYGLAGWEWFLNGAPKGNSQNISHYFVAVGDYEVVLVITDANGCKDTLSQMVHVHPVPEADFVASDTLGCAPAVISFSDRTMHIPNQWLWEFGDGNTSVLQNPVHTYQEDGIYNVKLTVTDRYGCSDEIEKINYIRLDHPEVDFNVEYVASCPPVRAVFRATGAGLTGIARWQWNMGNGTIITTLVDTLVYAYDRSGDYTVTLTGIDSLGCTVTDTLDEQINVLGDIVPAAVQIHSVSVLSNNQIEVKFAPHRGTDFDFYTVYRETPGQGYVAIDTLYYINDTLLIDNTPQANVRSYCYKVTTTNHCGSESSLGLTDPHCSINATAMPVPGQIVVSWNPYRGWNEVAQYEIYEVTSYNPLTVTFLAVVPGNVTRYVEPFDDCFNDRGYRIKATGLTPLQVSWSDTTQAVNTAGIRGNATDVVRATVENNEDVLVEWKNFELPGVSVIYLDRAIDGGPFNTLATMPVGEEKFRDRDVEVGLSSYAYRVYAQDSCGNYSPMSNVGKSVLLNADKDVNTTLLSWTPYEDWRFGVDEYRIEIMNDTTGRWELVDIVQGNVDEYRDTKTTLDQPEYCYRIWAVELGGNETVSLSNEVCLEVETSIHAPTAFTPNQDGVNEVFLLSGFHVQNYNLKIYSRWGMLLFETNDINQGWDGTFRGGQVNEGVYVYIAKGIGYNGQPFLKKGSVSLLR
ncbi:MAG: PKD domain-containing protein, partial [Bacteroidetes bacterium]